VFVSLRPHLPIRGRPFKFEIFYKGSKHENVVGKICVRGTEVYTRCVSELTAKHSFYRPSWIRITAICPKTDSARTTSEVNVIFHNAFNDGLSNLFWSGYNFLPIKVIKNWYWNDFLRNVKKLIFSLIYLKFKRRRKYIY
jgi:hypothetical protein